MKRSTIGLLVAATTLGIAIRLIASSYTAAFDYQSSRDFAQFGAADDAEC